LRTPLLALFLSALFAAPAVADYRVTRDHGGLVEQYKRKYTQIRDRGQRVVIDGICNSACTMVLGIVPLHRICVTPRASLGFHEAYLDKRWTAGVRVASAPGTAELLSYYPKSLRRWIDRNGGLTPQMKRLRNGPDLWQILDPCPDDF
jgi:hypothetical protein